MDMQLLINALSENLRKKSKSQLGQDLFVLFEKNFKHNGYFVEFGATDGITISNSYLLEKEYGWHGILAEPAENWHEALFRNRDAGLVYLDKRCVWDKNTIVDFTETPSPDLSGITSYQKPEGKVYQVPTITLYDLLEEYWYPPARIDYLSIDTEGSEFDILNQFFHENKELKFEFDIITVEHNYNTDKRQKIYDLLTSRGYTRKYEQLSAWDDWYVRERMWR